MANKKDNDLNIKSDYLTDLVEVETDKRIKDINALTSSITKLEKSNKLGVQNKMQKDIGSIAMSVKEVKDDIWDLSEDIDEMNTEGIKDIEKTTNKVLSKIGYTIDSLARGVTRITKSTATATKDAVSQYGRAISEDISFNKQNVIAMSLARSTPLFGYFAAKFMETDVFKNAYSNIKEKLGNAVSSGWEKVKSFFKRKPKEINAEEAIGSRAVRAVEESESEYAEIDRGAAERTIEKKAKSRKTKLEEKALESVTKKAEKAKQKAPKLQSGGYVEKGGLTNVHASEVVLPIEKVLREIDKASGSKEIMAKMGQNISMLTEAMGGTERYITQIHKERGSILETFKESYYQVGKTESWQDKMLRATLDLQAGLVGSTNRMEVAWERTLLEHPTMRNMIAFGRLLKSSFFGTLRFLFKARGGYLADVRRSTRSSNVFENVVSVLGLTYVNQMSRLDNISNYLKELAEYTTGKVISPIQQKTWTMFEKIKDYMSGKDKGKTNWSEKAIDILAKELALDRNAMREANITSLKSFLKPGGILKTMGINKKSVKEKFPLLGKLPFMGGKKVPSAAKGGIVKKTGLVNVHAGEVISGRSTEKNISRMADDIKSMKKSSNMGINLDKEKLFTLKKTRKGTEAVGEKVGGMSNRLKKTGKNLWTWLLFGFTMVKDTFMMIGGKMIMLLGLAVTALKWMAAKSGLTGTMKGIGTAGKIAGVGGLIMAGADAVEGVGKAKEWGTSKLSAGIGAALGGTEGSFSVAGATKGAAKGGMIGAGIGSIIPGVGTIIGGAFGAIAGGLLGFIGGKNIAKYLPTSMKGIKLITKGIWALIKFPSKAMWWLAKYSMKGLWWLVKSTFKGIGWISKKIIGAIWSVVTFPFTAMTFMVKKVISSINTIVSMDKDQFKSMMKTGLKFSWKILMLPWTIQKWFIKKTIGAIWGTIKGLWKVQKWIWKMQWKVIMLPFDIAKWAVNTTIKGVWKAAKAIAKIPKLIRSAADFTTKIIIFPFKALKWTIEAAVELIKETIGFDKMKSKVMAMIDPIVNIFSYIGGMFSKVEEWMKEKMYKIPVLGTLLRWYMEGEKSIEENAANVSGGIPSAKEGGITTRNGLVNMHAGEVITPLEKLKGGMNSSNLAKLIMGGDIIKEKARMESEEKLKKEMINNNSKNNSGMNNAIMNMTNIMSHSMKSVSSGVNNSGGMQGNQSYGTDYVSMVVNGNLE